MSTERWLPVVGYEGFYEVSDSGRVRSMSREMRGMNESVRVLKGRVLKQSLVASPRSGLRPTVALSKRSVVRQFQVSRLVAEAFILNPDGKPLVRHLDDVQTNNQVENLAWGDQVENMADYKRNKGHYLQRRDACIRGHKFTESTTYVASDGARRCRECRKITRKARTA